MKSRYWRILDNSSQWVLALNGDSNSYTLFTSGSPVDSNRSPGRALSIFRRLLEKKYVTFDDAIEAGWGKNVRIERDTLFHSMSALKNGALGNATLWRTNKTLKQYELLESVVVEKNEGTYDPRLSDGSGERLFAALFSNGMPVIPVIHSLLLVRRGTPPVPATKGVWYREIQHEEERLTGEHFCRDLTGWGDAEALRLVDRYCTTTGRELKPVLRASRFKSERLDDANCLWIGSPFNRAHDLRDHLLAPAWWKSETQCRFDHKKRSAGLELIVKWPDKGKRVVNLPDKTSRIKSYAYLRSARRIDGKGHLLIAGGTDTQSTLYAAQLLTERKYSGILDIAVARADGLMQCEALFQLERDDLDGEVRFHKQEWP
jgi:hypothetical protein